MPLPEVNPDRAALSLRQRTCELQIETAWERLEKQQPQCGYGRLGICCKNCNMGPCVVNPFGGEPSAGVCGADARPEPAQHRVCVGRAGGCSGRFARGAVRL